MSWLICIAGGIASGKTTLANALQASLSDSARLAFGDVVRRRMLADGLRPTRQNMQDTGMKLIAEGWTAFVSELLHEFDGHPHVLIVEGIRHQEAVDALRARLPMRKLLLVYLEVSSEQHRRRMAETGQVADVLTHDVEQDVRALCASADLLVTSEQSMDDLVRLVRQRIED